MVLLDQKGLVRESCREEIRMKPECILGQRSDQEREMGWKLNRSGMEKVLGASCGKKFCEWKVD